MHKSISECDIEYVSPSDYEPPEITVNERNTKSHNDADEAYERMVRKSLRQVEKQKVRSFHSVCFSRDLPEF